MNKETKDLAHANPTQGQQSARGGQSPVKEPAHETAHANPEKMAHDFAKSSPEGHHPDAHKEETRKVARNHAPLPRVDPNLAAIDHPDPVKVASSRIVSVDAGGTDMSGNTVDSDGKSREALRERKVRQDNFVHSNATLDEHVVTPPDGLGGIDSRFDGPGVSIATQPGWHVVDLGTTTTQDMNGPKTSRHIRLEQDDESD